MSCGWMECGWMDCGWIDCHWMNCGQRIDGHVIDDQSLSGAHTTSDVRRVGDPTSNRQMVFHKLGVDGWEVYASLEGSLAGMGCCSTVGSDLGSTDEHKGVVAEAVEMVVLGGHGQGHIITVWGNSCIWWIHFLRVEICGRDGRLLLWWCSILSWVLLVWGGKCRDNGQEFGPVVIVVEMICLAE